MDNPDIVTAYLILGAGAGITLFILCRKAFLLLRWWSHSGEFIRDEEDLRARIVEYFKICGDTDDPDLRRWVRRVNQELYERRVVQKFGRP